jgi:hypothetical protein
VGAGAKLSEALDATMRGRLFLLAPRSKRPRAGDTGYQRRATTDRVQVELAFSSEPDANYGVIPLPGLFVSDNDGGELPGELPITVTALTGGEPKNGRPRTHRWFSLPPELHDWQVKGRQAVLTEVDIVGSCGAPQYVVGVGCTHPDTGRVYQWAPNLSPADVPIAVAPSWLVDSLRADNLLIDPSSLPRAHSADALGPRADVLRIRTSKTTKIDLERSDWRAIAVSWVRDKLDGNTRIPKGRRQEILVRYLAGKLRAQGLGGAHVVEVLRQINRECCDPPINERALDSKLAARIERWKAEPAPARDTEISNQIDAMRARVEATSWSGAGGASEYKTLLVYLDTAQRIDSFAVALSVRRLGELAGIGFRTATRARNRLNAKGWLTLVQAGRKGRSDEYTIRDPSDTQLPASQKKRLCVPPGSLDADVYRHGKDRLGVVGMRLLAALYTGEVFNSAAALARAAGVSPVTTRKKLVLLQRLKLARRVRGGWQLGPGEMRLTHDLRNRDEVRHRVQRRLWHQERRDFVERWALVNHKSVPAAIEVPTPRVGIDELRAHGLATPALLADLGRVRLPETSADKRRLRVVAAAGPTRLSRSDTTTGAIGTAITLQDAAVVARVRSGKW